MTSSWMSLLSQLMLLAEVSEAAAKQKHTISPRKRFLKSAKPLYVF